MDTSHIAEELRGKGYRATKARVRLLSHIRDLAKPASITEIASALKKQMDLVTVYRTIDSFKKKGFVREVDFRQGVPLYESADEHDHHHVVCTDCGTVADFLGCEYEKLTKVALKQVRGFARIESHALELFGICNKCAH